MKKKIALLMAMVMLFAVTTAGTLAWLKDDTDPVVNTFTVGDIEITLTESEDLDLKMIPGKTITKDPKVTVTSDTTENSWLFVEVTASADADDYISWTIASGWTELTTAASTDGLTKVYYREVAAGAAENEFPVLANNEVTVLETVDEDDMQAVEDDEDKVQLTFTAYAVQRENVDDVEDAWSIAKTGVKA